MLFPLILFQKEQIFTVFIHFYLKNVVPKEMQKLWTPQVWKRLKSKFIFFLHVKTTRKIYVYFILELHENHIFNTDQLQIYVNFYKMHVSL